jgi:hypothetical protein
MITSVEMFQIKTGEVFDSEEAATAHILDKIGEDLDGIISTHLGKLSPAYAISRRAQMGVLLSLMGDLATCEKTKAVFDKYLG